MRRFFLARAGFRVLVLFGRELSRGNPVAYTVLAALLSVAGITGIVWYARRPLGGAIDKTPIVDDEFQDDTNVYRQTS